jgi:hypothetical protein
MHRYRRAEINRLDFGIREQFFNGAKNFNTGTENNVVSFLDIPGDAGQDAVYGNAALATNGDDLRLRIIQVSPQMGRAHETESHDGHLDW